MVDELTRFIKVDNREPMNIGDVEKDSVVLPIVEPKFSVDRPEAATREEAGEFALRRGDEGGLRTFTDTTNVGDNRWGPPLVDEDWHGICQAILKGIEGEEWEQLYYEHVEKCKAVNLRQPSASRKDKTQWKIREA